FLELGVAHPRAHQIHLSYVALILAIGRDLGRIGRPIENRALRLSPARVVGRVTEILRTIESELGLPAAGRIPHPEIPIADERLELPVRRGDARLVAGLRQARLVDAMAGAGQVAQVVPVIPGDLEAAGPLDADGGDGKLAGSDRLAEGLAEGARKLLLIEYWPNLAGSGSHHTVVIAAGIMIDVPEAPVVEPVHPLHLVVDERRGLIRHEALRAPVVLEGHFAPARGADEGQHHRQGRQKHQAWKIALFHHQHALPCRVSRSESSNETLRCTRCLGYPRWPKFGKPSCRLTFSAHRRNAMAEIRPGCSGRSQGESAAVSGRSSEAIGGRDIWARKPICRKIL